MIEQPKIFNFHRTIYTNITTKSFTINRVIFRQTNRKRSPQTQISKKANTTFQTTSLFATNKIRQPPKFLQEKENLAKLEILSIFVQPDNRLSIYNPQT